ncbi:uncharacterized protein LOC110954865 [Acanthochromis polyacanthus]|uniref:uncharacterized protein LOC110954865 n=1 Tax=Acanthochromis polyacanthus TaxID=80966 RepID=UPI000B903AE7|nr:uncharacterized protein LOC110954865 [Acanthochromis polyacanthus]XP_051812995.1 uncharacterized protein LOC110954865 [Acanthochromis polyacanthus]XP_051812997.1 uncharacterized protein LOC110954865 [Acanthochromis polyacanthus]
MAEEELLEALVITEDGDITETVTEKEAASCSNATIQSCNEESALKETGDDENPEDVASQLNLKEQSLVKQQNDTEEDNTKEDKPEDTNNGQNRNDSEGEVQTHEVMMIKEKAERPSDTEYENATENDPQVDIRRLNSSEEQPEGGPNQEEDAKKAHRLTPDFPEALYELLCTLQEGRRLNDQRCSFRMESGMRRRRCHSEPNTTKPANRVVFSSMTSLQKEEFFELVATAQARRLDDQRAQLERSPPPKPKARSFRGSIKQLSFVKKPAPVPVPKEDLYNMILTTQAQGRLEDQRSRAPGPMDDEDFFSLLLRVQGGRMDEQRTELPRLLQT